MNVVKDGNHADHKGLVITWLHHHLVEVPPRQHPLHTNLCCNMACSVFDGTRSLNKGSSHLIVPVSVSPLRFHGNLNITLHAEDRFRILQAENQLAWFTIVGQISSPPVVNTQCLNNASLSLRRISTASSRRRPSSAAGSSTLNLGVAPAYGGVVVEHGSHDDGAVEQSDDHPGVPELTH